MEPWLTGLSDDWCSTGSSHNSSASASNSRSSSACSVRRNSVSEKLEFTTKDLFTPSKLENVFAEPPPSAPASVGRRSSTIASRLRSKSLSSTLTPVKENPDDSKLTSNSSLPSNLSTGTQRHTFLKSRRRYVSSRSHSLSDSKIPQPFEETSIAEDFSAVDSSIIKHMTPAPKRTISKRHTSKDMKSHEIFTTSQLSTSSKSDDSKIAEDLAAELESFAKSVHAIKLDTRKPSMTTRDYMEEAEKVMEFIRARKPLVPTNKIAKAESSESLSDDDSTKEEFKRPPSRKAKYYQKSTDDQRHAIHDEKTANFLKKFQESEDLEILANASVLAAFPSVDNQAAEEASLIALPENDDADDNIANEGSVIAAPSNGAEEMHNDESYASEPAGMRILNEHHQGQEQHTAQPETMGSDHLHSDTGPQTIVTASSTTSVQRGMISSGTVSIPDRVGVMTFDREKQIWVKENSKAEEMPAIDTNPVEKHVNKDLSEIDPFADIPDLSFDELREDNLKQNPTTEIDEKAPGAQTVPKTLEEPEKVQQVDEQVVHPKATPFRKSSLKSKHRTRPAKVNRSSSRSLKLAEHEKRLHEGLVSEDIYDKGKQQPRAVTIAFSSPIAYEIPLREPPSMSDIERDDPNHLPLDDEGSTIANSPAKSIPEHEYISDSETETSPHRSNLENLRRWYLRLGSINQKRRVSRIVEEEDEGYDTNDNKEYRDDKKELSMVHIPKEDTENYDDNREMSLVHLRNQELTPMPERRIATTTAKINSSILSLTPLSEFTLHQIDRLNHPEESFVAPRVNSKTLRQAHGSHALLEDALVRAITDAEPTELFWEQLKKLSLQNSDLSTLYGLKEYCSSLQNLDVTRNKISQLTDLPVSLRTLNIPSNLINDLTSWTHLHNLQSVDVSGNQLESLDCFGGLIHLRKLNASDNRIRRIDGILELSGLISLDLSGNDIAEVDFYDTDLASLEHLYLSTNNLVYVRNLDRIPRLKYADFTDNVLKDFNTACGKAISRLKTLYLARNQLKTIDLTKLPHLERLNIDENLVTEIVGLVEAENLTTLSARAQILEEPSNLINDILSTPHDITEIYISSNALSGRGLQLPTVPNYTLRVLEMASCGIKDIPPTFGEVFPNMRVLNLNFNALSTTDLGSLRGMTKLRTLLLAKNRIKRMRRTCLTLEKFESLRRLDVRDNPLTVGFYDPLKDTRFEAEGAKARSDYRLPERMVDADKQWISVMDETTCARRAITHLMIAQGCKNIEELDGLAFDRDRILSEEYTWRSMVTKGVLVSFA